LALVARNCDAFRPDGDGSQDSPFEEPSRIVHHVQGQHPSPIFVFPVEAGEQVVVLEAAKSSAGTAEAYDATLTARYVPFGPSGGATLDRP
jgi:hypothetical protein